MKKLMPYMLSLTLLVTGVSAAFAVEKKQKSTPPPKRTEQAAKDSSTKPTKPADKKSDPKATPQAKDDKGKTEKKYDNFVDKNNNGVDDRRENLKKKDTK